MVVFCGQRTPLENVTAIVQLLELAVIGIDIVVVVHAGYSVVYHWYTANLEVGRHAIGIGCEGDGHLLVNLRYSTEYHRHSVLNEAVFGTREDVCFRVASVCRTYAIRMLPLSSNQEETIIMSTTQLVHGEFVTAVRLLHKLVGRHVGRHVHSNNILILHT